MNKIFHRRDYSPLVASFEYDDENDLNDYSVYIRVEDSIIRINYANKKSGRVKYDFITSPEIQPSYVWLNNQLDLTLSSLLTSK